MVSSKAKGIFLIDTRSVVTTKGNPSNMNHELSKNQQSTCQIGTKFLSAKLTEKNLDILFLLLVFFFSAEKRKILHIQSNCLNVLCVMYCCLQAIQ